MCRKRCYSKPEAAAELQHCAEKRAAGNRRRMENRMYWCRTCMWWHLTSNPQPEADREPRGRIGSNDSAA